MDTFSAEEWGGGEGGGGGAGKGCGEGGGNNQVAPVQLVAIITIAKTSLHNVCALAAWIHESRHNYDDLF